MPFECPHCTKAIEGAMSQATHVERLSAKDSEIATLKGERDTATQRAMSAASQMERLEAVALSAAFSAAGVPDDPTIRHGFKLFHQAAMEGKPDGERTTLAEWVTTDAARQHPMLTSHYGKPTETPAPADPATQEAEALRPPQAAPAQPPQAAPPQAAPPTQPASTPTPKPPPNGETGATDPPTKTEEMTPERLSAYLRSDQYRALPAAKQKEEFDRLKSQMGMGDLFNPADAPGVFPAQSSGGS